MKKTIYLIAVCLACILTGCSDTQHIKKDRRYMTTPNISYVKDFPKEIALKESHYIQQPIT